MNVDRKGWGKVYFCPTPVGNLRDITLRVLDTLQSVDYVVCEDTRVTLKLLNAYRIVKPLLSYHSHNVPQATREILRLVRRGKNIAFVSDAGMPGIQDPGMELVPVLLREGVPFEVLPGPSAFLLGVVYSGFAFSGFVFLGFLPRKKKERRMTLERALLLPQSLVFYESPKRLWETLNDLRDTGGETRRVLVARELTKFHEEMFRGTVQEVQEALRGRDLRGEVLLVVEGASRDKQEFRIPEKLFDLLQKHGMTRKEIVEILSEGLGLEKNVLKRQIAALEGRTRQWES